jgi:uncharacterized protein
VQAGADLSAKNDAGHDAIFLAERVDWNTSHDDGYGISGDGDSERECEAQIGETNITSNDNNQTAATRPPPPMTPARQVVTWLLGCEKGAGLERPVGDVGTATDIEIIDGVSAN